MPTRGRWRAPQATPPGVRRISFARRRWVMVDPGRSTHVISGRLLSARRALVSLSAGLATGAMVGLAATPRLLPLVSWTVTVAVLLTWVWRMSWRQDSEGTKRLAEQEGTNRSTDVWLLVAAV